MSHEIKQYFTDKNGVIYTAPSDARAKIEITHISLHQSQPQPEGECGSLTIGDKAYSFPCEGEIIYHTIETDPYIYIKEGNNYFALPKVSYLSAGQTIINDNHGAIIGFTATEEH